MASCGITVPSGMTLSTSSACGSLRNSSAAAGRATSLRTHSSQLDFHLRRAPRSRFFICTPSSHRSDLSGTVAGREHSGVRCLSAWRFHAPLRVDASAGNHDSPHPREQHMRLWRWHVIGPGRGHVVVGRKGCPASGAMLAPTPAGMLACCHALWYSGTVGRRYYPRRANPLPPYPPRTHLRFTTSPPKSGPRAPVLACAYCGDDFYGEVEQ